VNGRLWVISELYYPEVTSTGHFLTKIAEGLASHHRVKVLCGQPSYAARGIRAPRLEIRNGVNIQRCPSTTFDKDVLLFRLVNIFTLCCSIFFCALMQFRKGDCVLVVTTPPPLPFLTVLACFLRKAKSLLLIHDVYPEVLVATGIAKPTSFIVRLGNRLTTWLYRSAHRIIVLGRDMEKLVNEKLGSETSRTIIIPNWGDLDQVTPTKRKQNPLLAELGLQDKFVIQYAGNMGRTHGLETLWESAEGLRSVKDVHFLFIGSGGKKKWLELAVKRSGLTNVTLLPFRPRHDLVHSLNACDVAIISFIPGMAGISVPSRMYNILASGKPILAVTDPNSELALVVQEEGVGWVIPPGKPDKLVETILTLRSRPTLLAEMGSRARAAAEGKYSLTKVIDSYLALLRDACFAPGGAGNAPVME
jgi:colanic acid biosynthesis glycosyl transferase WcaI